MTFSEEGGKTATTDRNDTFFVAPKAQTTIFAIFCRFRFNLRIKMPALKVQTKMLGYFARKQPMTLLFSNSRLANAPGCPPLRSPGLARRPPKTDKFGNFPILEKSHVMTWKLGYLRYCESCQSIGRIRLLNQSLHCFAHKASFRASIKWNVFTVSRRILRIFRALCEFSDRKSTRLNSSHNRESRMPSSA